MKKDTLMERLASSMELEDTAILAIGYDTERNDAVVFINPELWLAGRVRALSPEQRGELIDEISRLARKYFVELTTPKLGDKLG